MNTTFPETRSQGERLPSVQTLYRTIKSSDSTIITRSGSDEEFIPIHVVNYNYTDGRDAGFVVMTDDERVSDPFFVYNNEGNWSADSLGDFGIMFFDLMDGYLQHSIAENNEAEQLQTRNLPSRCNKIVEFVSNNSSSHECRIGVTWDQVTPYNFYSPKCDYCNTRSLAGCIPVAMAQIMAYHQKPASATCSRLAPAYANQIYNWTLMKSSPKVFDGDSHKYMVTHLLAVCGEKSGVAYNCAIHGQTGSNNLMGARSALQTLGYNNVVYNTGCDFNAIRSSIDNNRPVIISGRTTTNGNNGHAWVIEGYSYTDEHWVKGEECNGVRNVYNDYKKWYSFYFNLGWGGSQDGYYSGTMFDFSTINFNCKYTIETISGMY